MRGNPSITLRQLWHFVTAAEAGTISEAARRLHMAPSAISMSLSELERLTGAQLAVKRKAHGLTLTSAGKAAYVQAREILDLADELMYVSGDDRARIRGPLTVGCYMPLAPAVIPHMLELFAQTCPDVTVNFVEGYHEDLQDWLATGAIDVAFVYDSDLGPDVRTVSLLPVRPYVLLAEDHELTHRRELALSDVAEEPLVLFDAPPISTRILELYRDANLDARVRHRSRSYATVRSLVGAGAGVGVLFQRPKLDLSYVGLRVTSRPLIGTTAEPPYVALAWSRGSRLNARTRAWIDVARGAFLDEDEDW